VHGTNKIIKTSKCSNFHGGCFTDERLLGIDTLSKLDVIALSWRWR